jgi:pyridoxine 5-phosphate synthase
VSWRWCLPAIVTFYIDTVVSASLRLGVNVDHVATLRQARYRTMMDAHNVEPSVLEAARTAIRAGAHSITVHLRADRRHIQDADVWTLREEPGLLMNLEMGNTPEIVDIAMRLKPAFVCLVPENREEVTTEGGLDVEGQRDALEKTVRALEANGTRVSLFIDVEEEQFRAAAAIGASAVELHTGTFANETGVRRLMQAERLADGANFGHSLGLQINAGHGLTVENVKELFMVPHLTELNIGHHLVSRAISVGLESAIKEMLDVMKGYGEAG